MSSGKEAGSIFLLYLHHAYAQTDGTYAWPNSREGDMLKQGSVEVVCLRAELAATVKMLDEVIKQRDEAQEDICYDEAMLRYETGHEVHTPEGVAAEKGWNHLYKKQQTKEDI
jgi:hypothetical protein